MNDSRPLLHFAMVKVRRVKAMNKDRSFIFVFAPLTALLLLGAPAPTRGATAIQVDLGANPLVALPKELVFGWEFNVNVPIQLHHIGLFDAGSDGFEHSWKVNIWSLDGMGTNSIDFGSGTLTENGFSYVETFVELGPDGGVHGPTLQPGHFVIAAGLLNFEEGGDLMPSQVASIATDPAITFLQARSGLNTLHDEDLVFPDTAEPRLKYFGPNFQFDVIPEPSVLILLAAGAALCTAARRRAR